MAYLQRTKQMTDHPDKDSTYPGRAAEKYMLGVRVEMEPPAQIKLSRRNLLSLLHKLEMKGSARTLIKPAGEADVVIVAEHDEVHYDRKPGPMHPETEQFVAAYEAWRRLARP